MTVHRYRNWETTKETRQCLLVGNHIPIYMAMAHSSCKHFRHVTWILDSVKDPTCVDNDNDIACLYLSRSTRALFSIFSK